MSITSDAATVTKIRPPAGFATVDLMEVWRYRELLWTLAMRDIRVRYKQSLLGVCWAIIPPLMTMLVFNILFSILMGAGGRPTVEGVPYAISTYCALVPWQFFATSLNNSGRSLVVNRALITKVYFPRLITPVAPILSAMVDFLIALAFLFFLIAGYQVFTEYQFTPTLKLLLIPIFSVYVVLTLLSLSLWIAGLNAIYRDVQYALPFFIQLMMFVTPVIYPAQSILKSQPHWVSIIYGLNPMAGVVEGFRWILLGVPAPDIRLLAASFAMTLLLLVGGIFYFARLENEFVDLV